MLFSRTGAIDFEPVVKLFTPDGNATWLLTELDPNGAYLAFGLCDLGLGEPELGYVSLPELAAARRPPPAARWAFRSSAISTSHRRERSPPTPNSRANIGALSPDAPGISRLPSSRRFFRVMPPFPERRGKIGRIASPWRGFQ